MADPIVERIAQELAARVANVTTANSYNQTLIVEQPVRLGVESLKDRLAAIIQEDPVPNEEIAIAGNPYAQGWDTEFTVALFSMVSEKSAVPARTILNRMWADTVKAVTRKGQVNEQDWHSFGGLAINSVVSSPVYGVAEDGSHTVVAFSVTVSYRTNENDPYTAR